MTTTEGHVWDCLDLGTYAIFTNGTKLVVRTASTGAYAASDSFSTMPRFGTGCVFKGQLVCGNIKTTWHGCGTNSVIWSSIGTNDFTPGVDNVKGSANEAGFRTEMHWTGEVYMVRRIGGNVIVYGDSGIGVLFPAEETFGYRELTDYGIISKRGAGGNNNKQLVIAADGTAYMITVKFSAYGGTYEEIEPLGYKEYFSAMEASEIMISYDSGNDEFYISDSSNCYLLTKNGLCEVYQLVTSCSHLAGVTNGIVSDTADYTASLTTERHDFEERGIKTIMGLEFGVYHPGNDGAYSGYGAVNYRYNKTADFTTGSNIILNPSGVMTQPTGGEEFQFRGYFTNYAGIKLDYIKVDVKMTDRRFMRGPSARNLIQVTE